LVGTSSALDLAALTPTRWVGQGATIAVPLTVEALDLGVPKANVTVNFSVSKGTASLSAGSAATNGSGFATITAQLTNQNADVQVSACVAPNNSPCQTFTLFSTAASLWTLGTVSGSSQVVPTGQAFQPLVMRVTDGSPAANPVMGVTLTFATTLTRVSPGASSDSGGRPDGESFAGGNGVPVLLGSSQAQVVTTQNGLASIVPSVGNVGLCDVFIAVTAGASTAQFQMESLAAIVPEQPEYIRTKAPTTPPFAHFGFQTSASENAAAPLFAAPEGDPGNEPVADSHVSTCPEPTADAAFRDHRSSAPSTPAVPAMNEKADPAPCPRSKLPEPKAPKNAAGPELDSHAAVAESAIPLRARSERASIKWLPDDKRSCRVLAADGSLF